jgi:hypothetical protein
MGDRTGAYRVLVGRPDGNNHLKNLSVDGRIILKWILGSGMGGNMDWNNVAHKMDRRRELVNGVMNPRVP